MHLLGPARGTDALPNVTSPEVTGSLPVVLSVFQLPGRDMKLLRLSVMSWSVLSVQVPLTLSEARFPPLVTGQR